MSSYAVLDFPLTRNDLNVRDHSALSKIWQHPDVQARHGIAVPASLCFQRISLGHPDWSGEDGESIIFSIEDFASGYAEIALASSEGNFTYGGMIETKPEATPVGLAVEHAMFGFWHIIWQGPTVTQDHGILFGRGSSGQYSQLTAR